MRILKRVIAVFIVVLTAFLLVPKGKAASVYVPENDSAADKNGTNTYEGDVNYFQEYTSSINKLENYTKNYSAPEGEDTVIEEIIPIQCFSKRATHIHIGIKYGFYVNTKRKKDKINTCEVFIFKIGRSLNKNPNGMNEGVDHKTSTSLPYAVFTQFKPVLSNTYTYEYVSDTEHHIYSLNETNDIAINYASNILNVPFGNSNAYRSKTWTAVRGKWVVDNTDEIAQCGLDTLNCLCDFAGDVLYDILKWKYQHEVIAILLRSVIQGGGNILVEYLDGTLTPERLGFLVGRQILTVAQELASGSNNKGANVAEVVAEISNFILNFVDIISDISEGNFPSFNTWRDTICDGIDLFLKTSKFLCKELVKDNNYISRLDEAISDVVTLYNDVINLGASAICTLIAICKGNRTETLSNVIYGKTNCGTLESKDLRIRAEYADRVSFYNFFEFNPKMQPANGYLEVNTELQFRNGKSNYKSVTATYKMKYYDEDINNVHVSTPDYSGRDFTSSAVTISDGSNSHYAYFRPKFDGEYNLTVKTDDGQECSYCLHKVGYNVPTNSLKKNELYEIIFYTDSVIGNHFINVTMKGISVTYNKSTTYYCSSTGYYYFNLNTNNSDAYLNLTSVSYNKKYTYTGYSYTRPVEAMYSKEGNTNYKVYLESGYTYSIKYTSNCNVGINITDNFYRKSTTYTCNNSGYYYFTINTSNTDVYYELTNVSYSQTYYFTGYSYTRLSYASYTKVNNKQYKVYLEAGKTYNISYKCNYSVGLNIA